MADPIEVEIIQGDTGPLWQIGVPEVDTDGDATGSDADLTTYTCTLRFVNSANAEVTRTVTAKNAANDKFLCQLYSTETDAMNVGKNKVVWEIRDNSVVPDFVSEVQFDVKIKQQRYQP